MKAQEIEKILPNKGQFQLSKHEQITDLGKFKEAHLSFLYGNKGNMVYMPYYERLLKVANEIRVQ